MTDWLALGISIIALMIAVKHFIETERGLKRLKREREEIKHTEEDILEKNRQCEEQEKNGLGVFVVLKKVYLTSPEGINHVAYFDKRNCVMYTQIAPVEDLMRHGYTWEEVADEQRRSEE